MQRLCRLSLRERTVLSRSESRLFSGFTLIELMIVIGIIAVLISLLLPAVQSAREQARRTQCTNNLLQLGVALANYASTHNVLPPGVVNDKGPIENMPDGYHHSWVVQILPYFGQNNIYRSIDLRASVYAAENGTVRSVMISTLVCPSDGYRSLIAYSGCHHDVDAPIAADNHGVLFLNSRVRLDEITDGLATTVLLGETTQGNLSFGWMSGTRATLRNMGQPLNTPDLLFPTMRARARAPVFSATIGQPKSKAGISPPAPQYTDGFLEVVALVEDGMLPIDYVGGFGSSHPDGANFLLCNGSVRFVRHSIDLRVYKLLGNRADGELIGDDAF
jgi:prepilin-type N-terminal cleavage/methylation domain-containing protein